MLNGIFVFIVVASIFLAAASGNMQAVTDAILKDSRTAVDISLKLIGVMAFFLGLMKVAENGGLLRLISRAVAPVMRRLFPGVPPEHLEKLLQEHHQAEEAGVGHRAEGEHGPRPVAEIVETPGQRQQGEEAGNHNDGHPP